MATANNPQAWSGTPASNDGADSNIGTLSDTMNTDSVDNALRGIMAGVANYKNDTDGYATAGGSADALTVSSQQGLSSGHLTDGFVIGLWAASTNTVVGPTLNVDSLGAKTLKRADGSALAVGSIQAGMFLDCAYEAGAGVFCIKNIPPITSASATAKGDVELATAAEVTTGTDTTRAVTPEAIASSHICRIATGEYTGDGTTSQAITGVGFRPKFVKIWLKLTGDGTSMFTYHTTDVMVDNHANGVSVRQPAFTTTQTQHNQIISLDSDGFTVDDNGADEAPNTNGAEYEYLCLG